ncbi:hypothetical protein NDN08_007472 [Rhodosorus marinus]|uniref:Magnesium transport protein CorA n=1 Tax=Rhodosorus marinus TaxID=101924 RepID=A0AAV8V1R8_9RHOD|nr:hypothetical protein NDN08_007472 [Rhodosorus marinus]
MSNKQKLLAKSWAGDVSYMIETDDEGAHMLPRGQRQLVSREKRSSVLERDTTAERSRSNNMHRKDSSLEAVVVQDTSESYGAINRTKLTHFSARKRGHRSNSILDGMIKSEKYEESSRKRYMVPRMEEDDEDTSPVSMSPATTRIIEYEDGELVFDNYVSNFGQYLETRGDLESIIWLHVEGPPEHALAILADKYKIHPLAQEDVCTTPQRPKLDQYDEMLFIITHSPELLEQDPGSFEFGLNQVSVFALYRHNLLVTFHEHRNENRGNWVQRVEERVRNNTEEVRGKDLSHLLYAVIDSVTDRYFPLLEFYGDRMEELESALVDDPDPELIKGITRLKRDLLLVRRTVWPMRECTSRLMVLSDDIIRKATKMYLRDLQDHLVQVVDILETYRDVSMSLLDLYLSATNNKMQEVMKTLTIISTIFIPLTFITGVYGMNFEYMPELSWPFSYLIFWIFVIAIIMSQLYYFHRLGWT